MNDIKKSHDAVLICSGSEEARDLTIPGREASGIHTYAMDFLPIQNKIVSGEINQKDLEITAKNKHVVIGGGDTGSDFIGTSIRQGAKSVTQIEIMPMPPKS